MPKITQSKTREIIEDFAKEISAKKIATAKPAKTVINFRNDKVDGNERDVVRVPINILRFRKNNGRIASDVIGYERTHGPLDESDEGDQEELGKFLRKKDPEKMEILMRDIRHVGQTDPVIITCDGFLIDGNRRKMVIEDLLQNHPNEDKFEYMKVVILPGEGDEGGAPTKLELEKLENRYQLQKDGKSEYYGLDRALSIRRKVENDLSLKEQVTDDSQYAGRSEKEIEKAIRTIEKKYLRPLDCVDRYLRQFGREGRYDTISTGMRDKEGRWQAFVDVSAVLSRFNNSDYLMENGIAEDEVGDFEEAAFNIIRLRDVPGTQKVHDIMRVLPKYFAAQEGKKEILDISKKIKPLSGSECYKDDNQEAPLSSKEEDFKWVTKNKEAIIFHLKRAEKAYESQQERETPIGLLDAALKKLKHKDMDLSDVSIGEYKKARGLTVDIQKEAKNLEQKLYELEKKPKRLPKKFR